MQRHTLQKSPVTITVSFRAFELLSKGILCWSLLELKFQVFRDMPGVCPTRISSHISGSI